MRETIPFGVPRNNILYGNQIYVLWRATLASIPNSMARRKAKGAFVVRPATKNEKHKIVGMI